MIKEFNPIHFTVTWVVGLKTFVHKDRIVLDM